MQTKKNINTGNNQYMRRPEFTTAAHVKSMSVNGYNIATAAATPIVRLFSGNRITDTYEVTYYTQTQTAVINL